MQGKRELWVSDASVKKVKQVKDSFQHALTEQAKEARINYYDFLLVAKKLSFRFEESGHLMALKNFFSKNKNSILIKKLVDCLSLSQESLTSKDEKMYAHSNPASSSSTCPITNSPPSRKSPTRTKKNVRVVSFRLRLRRGNQTYSEIRKSRLEHFLRRK